MGLFKSDLYRSFVVGFALGAVIMIGTLNESARSQIAAEILPSALAAAVK